MVLVMILLHCEVNPYSGSLSSRLKMKSNSSAKKETVFTAISLFICLFVYFFLSASVIPVLRGCTESLALVKSAMSLRGPPLARCCRWCFLSSDRGRKRFIIL